MHDRDSGKGSRTRSAGSVNARVKQVTSMCSRSERGRSRLGESLESGDGNEGEKDVSLSTIRGDLAGVKFRGAQSWSISAGHFPCSDSSSQSAYVSPCSLPLAYTLPRPRAYGECLVPFQDATLSAGVGVAAIIQSESLMDHKTPCSLDMMGWSFGLWICDLYQASSVVASSLSCALNLSSFELVCFYLFISTRNLLWESTIVISALLPYILEARTMVHCCRPRCRSFLKSPVSRCSFPGCARL
jgi:hypothetical protein